MQRPQRETVTLNDILITDELLRRSPRPPNWQAQALAMQPLARQMARDSETLLQTLVDLAVELCQAGSAGVSLPQTTEAGEDVFRWSVISGALASLVGNTTSRNSSCCGVCLERGTPQLFAYPDRYFNYFQVPGIPVVEVLVLPLQADRHNLGTIWIFSHDEQRHFDSEDVRVMTSLADFTAAALQLMQRQTRELITKNAQLEASVGDRQLSEIALRESEELSRALIKNLPGGAVFVVDRNLRYQLAEGEALSAAGFKSEDLVGQTIFSVMPPELTANYEQWYRQGLAGEPFEYEHDAHDRSYISRGTPLRLPNGEVYAVLAVSYDISKRKQAEATLRESEARQAFLLRLSDVLRFIADPVEIEEAVTQTAMNYFGADRCYYCEIEDDIAIIRRDAARDPLPSVAGVYPFSFAIFKAVADAGRPFIVHDVHTTDLVDEDLRQLCIQLQVISFVDVPVIKNGKPVGILCLVQSTPRDWTDLEVELAVETADRTWGAVERARAEVALHESERKLQSAIAVAQLSPYEWNPLTGELKWDARLKAMWGLPADAEVNYEIHNAGIHPQDREYVELLVAKAIDPNGDGIFAAEFRTVGIEDKIERWVSVRGQTFFDGASRPVHYVGAAQDVTDRKQAEADRIQLIQEQAAREEERQRAETLAQLDRAKTAFFNNVSHEFRTPLTLLLAPLQDALSDRTHPLPQEQRERLELSQRNAMRLLKLVNTLLDFSRIEAGRRSAVYEPTDLARFTTELASVFRSAIERAGLRLVVDCPPMREPVYVDREMWEKIVLNLLSNAFKFTFAGEIAVRLHRADDFGLPKFVVLEVQDTGTGIPPEELPHLFERFYQIRGAKARTHEGSGIGLALVLELIRLHGGTIDVSSTVGQGTCFTVTIPLGTAHLPNDRIEAARTLVSTALSAAPYVEEAEGWLPEADFRLPILVARLGSTDTESGNSNSNQQIKNLKSKITPVASTGGTPARRWLQNPKSKILLVDDNADMRDYLTRILSEHAQVEAVADGAAALAAVQERVPDLVLSDVMMPGLYGFELLLALRADPRTREVPIILLSARAGVESVVEGLEAGADDYLIKPFSAKELVTRVNAHLQMAQQRLEALRFERTTSRRKDEMLSTVSHELNTPLVAILGWTRLLRTSPLNQSMLMKSLETIERNATLQAKLIQDLLDISRITAGKLRLSLQPVELQSVIETAIATVSQTQKTKDIRLECMLDPRPIIIQGDPDRLQQIVLNLLTNAIKFTPQGGRIEVRLSLIGNGASGIGHRAMPNSHCPIPIAQIQVSDTGCGIDAEFLPYVFDTFRQAESSNSTKGLGLGLAIARHLVELHGGTIHAESLGVGQGATFTVNLPLKAR